MPLILGEQCAVISGDTRTLVSYVTCSVSQGTRTWILLINMCLYFSIYSGEHR